MSQHFVTHLRKRVSVASVMEQKKSYSMKKEGWRLTSSDTEKREEFPENEILYLCGCRTADSWWAGVDGIGAAKMSMQFGH